MRKNPRHEGARVGLSEIPNGTLSTTRYSQCGTRNQQNGGNDNGYQRILKIRLLMQTTMSDRRFVGQEAF